MITLTKETIIKEACLGNDMIMAEVANPAQFVADMEARNPGMTIEDTAVIAAVGKALAYIFIDHKIWRKDD